MPNPVSQSLRDERRSRKECPGCGEPSVPKEILVGAKGQEQPLMIRVWLRHRKDCYIKAGERVGLQMLKETLS